MDRFIEQEKRKRQVKNESLKSNMDRFIDYFNIATGDRWRLFKIQYG